MGGEKMKRLPTKAVSVREARANFADILGEVFYGKQVITIMKKNRPFAVLLNPEEFSRLRRKNN